LLADEAGANENLNLGGRVAGDFHADADFNDHWCGPSHCVSSVWNFYRCFLLIGMSERQG
jgi:hypothetical protein